MVKGQLPLHIVFFLGLELSRFGGLLTDDDLLQFVVFEILYFLGFRAFGHLAFHLLVLVEETLQLFCN